MRNFESEYVFVRRPPDRDELPSLKPDARTANLNFRFEALPLGQRPLKFTNGWREENLAQGIRSPTPAILFDGTNLVVEEKIRMRLVRHGHIPNLHIYPAIYVDDDKKAHENYWYLTFTERFDCWDRESSDYNREGGVTSGGVKYWNVFSYRFDEALMKRTPLEQRLLFKLGGSLDAYIVAHASVLTKFFGTPGVNGAEYVRVADY